MLKKTHERIITLIYDELPSTRKDLLSYKTLFKGSTLPDKYLPYRLMIHDYKGSIALVMSLINDILIHEQTPEALGLKLGIISHFIIDTTTAFHSNPAYKNKHLRHHAYEVEIEHLWDDLRNVGGPVISSLETIGRDIEAYLDGFQSSLVLADPLRDLEHGVSMSRSLIHLILDAYVYEQTLKASINHNLPRVALISDTYYPHVNGVSNTIHETVRHFRRTGQPYILITPKYKKPFWNKLLGIHLHTVPSIKFPFYPSAVIPLPIKHKLNRVLDNFQPDVIHTLTEFNLGHFALRYGKKRHIPVVTNYSSYFHLGMKHMKIGLFTKPLNAYLAWFHKKADLKTCPSSVTRDYLLGQGFQNISVFSRGIDTNRFSPRFRSADLRASWNATDKQVFLYVGRVSGEKDMHVLCDAYGRIPEQIRSKTKLVITGDGPLLTTLKKTYQDIIFTGQKTGDDLSKIYASADIFAFPSPSETFGNVVLEAMASGLPVIVSDEGGVLETAVDGVNGIIFKARDVESMKHAMIALATDSTLTDTLRTQALNTAQDRTWTHVFETLNSHYSTLISAYQNPDQASTSTAVSRVHNRI
ncbi:MAG: glycosyltransferase [Acholeplasmataceae bacterium]|nr:glycosyltransferase [Acholeplasmataceae bacterium]